MVWLMELDKLYRGVYIRDVGMGEWGGKIVMSKLIIM